MSYRDWYNVKPEGIGWRVYKFSSDRDPQGSYFISSHNGQPSMCECFAGTKHTCRHRDLVRMFLMNEEFRTKMINSWLYNYDKDKYIEPAFAGDV